MVPILFYCSSFLLVLFFRGVVFHLFATLSPCRFCLNVFIVCLLCILFFIYKVEKPIKSLLILHLFYTQYTHNDFHYIFDRMIMETEIINVNVTIQINHCTDSLEKKTIALQRSYDRLVCTN